MNPSTQPAAAPPAEPDNSILKTDVVDNIPIHSQSTPAGPAGGDDPELDKIMQDVGHELEKNVQRPKKHHLFSKKDKPVKKSEARLSAQPVDRVANAPAPIHDVQPPTAAMPAQTPPAQASPQTQPQPQTPAQAKPAKPKTPHSVPIFMILVTLIITSALVVAAIAAYKQK